MNDDIYRPITVMQQHMHQILEMEKGLYKLDTSLLCDSNPDREKYIKKRREVQQHINKLSLELLKHLMHNLPLVVDSAPEYDGYGMYHGEKN